MTRVDFYIVGDTSESARLRIAARIAEKAMLQNQHVYINTGDSDESRRLDELLWTFSQSSFVPHRIIESPSDEFDREPVVIGTGVAIHDPCDVMINLAESVPDFFSRYDRVAEIVDGDASRRDAGRVRYKYYRDRGYELNSHKV